MVIFCLQLWKGPADSKNTKRLSQEEIKRHLLESIIINEAVESEELNKEAGKVQDPEEAAKVIQKYEYNIKTKKKRIIGIAMIKARFLKSLRVKRKLASRLGIHKNAIIFKINVFKLCERYPKLLGSFIGLEFFKNYHKDIKTVCRKNEQEFSKPFAHFLSVFIFQD